MTPIARSLARALAMTLVLSLAAGCAPAVTPSPPPSPVAPSASASPAASSVACRYPQVEARWWDDRVFYEVFVRSFADSDGDGIGDLRGLTDRLDYLNDGDPATTEDLGITGIWLMPIFEAASYHGYDVIDYRRIDPDYGTQEDFVAFMDAANERGIEVILDLVLNHTSTEHPWFVESRDPASPRADWYRWSDTDPGYGGPSGQVVWHADGERFYYGQFWSGMPDLDLTNPDVTDELVDVARFWLEDYGVSGFRLDAIKHLVEDGQEQQHTPETIDWLVDFKARVHEIASEALLVGEVYDPTLLSSRYMPDAVDLTFDFDLASQILIGARVGEAPSLATTQRKLLEAYEGGAYAAFITNHDQARVMTELNDPGKVRVAATALLTQPGVPFVYYGEEIGLAGGKPDERIRTPMPWTGEGPGHGFTSGTPWEPLEPGWETANVADQWTDGSLLDHYRSLIALRDDLPALRRGAYQALRSTAPTVYAFIASRDGQRVAVITNLGDEDVTGFALELRGDTTCAVERATVAYADGVTVGAEAAAPSIGGDGSLLDWRPVPGLPAFSTLVLELED